MDKHEFKELIKQSGIYQWQVAAKIGISEMTLIRWLRFPLSEEQLTKISAAIKELKKDKGD